MEDTKVKKEDLSKSSGSSLEEKDRSKLEREEAISAQKDKEYAQRLKEQILAQNSLLHEKKRDFQHYFNYNQATLSKKYPKSLLAKKSRPFPFTMEQLADASQQVVKLVPVRIDVEHDGVKIRDDFTWNVNGMFDPSALMFLESVITHDSFAKLLCRDVGIKQPPKALTNQIVASLKDQIDDYFQHSPAALDPREDLTRGNDGVDDGLKDLPELRTVIKLDITIEQQRIVDQFEWDISCNH
jgi:hypothetical protein